MKTIILGLGNPILSDDSIGIKVVRKLKKENPKIANRITETYAGGLNILDELEGFERAILIDSIRTGKYKVGTLLKLSPENFNTTDRLSYSHGIDYFSAIELGKKLGYKMPKEVIIFAIEVKDNYQFSEELSEELKDKLEEIIERIKGEV